MSKVSEKGFEELLKERLGSFWSRALRLFRECKNLAFDITNVLMRVADQGSAKVEEVLEILEKHYEEHLCFQHPEIRGTISQEFGNPTKDLFLSICKNTLGLQPNEAQ